MAERNISLSPIVSDQLQFCASTQSLDQLKKEYGPIKPYNYKCQLDQYNVKLCGVVFDAIGEPDFILKSDNLENEVDTLE